MAVPSTRLTSDMGEARHPAFETLHTLPASRTEDDTPAHIMAKLKTRQQPDHG